MHRWWNVTLRLIIWKCGNPNTGRCTIILYTAGSYQWNKWHFYDVGRLGMCKEREILIRAVAVLHAKKAQTNIFEQVMYLSNVVENIPFSPLSAMVSNINGLNFSSHHGVYISDDISCWLIWYFELFAEVFPKQWLLSPIPQTYLQHRDYLKISGAVRFRRTWVGVTWKQWERAGTPTGFCLPD